STDGTASVERTTFMIFTSVLPSGCTVRQIEQPSTGPSAGTSRHSRSTTARSSLTISVTSGPVGSGPIFAVRVDVAQPPSASNAARRTRTRRRPTIPTSAGKSRATPQPRVRRAHRVREIAGIVKSSAGLTVARFRAAPYQIVREARAILARVRAATRIEGGPAVSLYVMLSTLSESGRKVLRERRGWIRKVNADVRRGAVCGARAIRLRDDRGGTGQRHDLARLGGIGRARRLSGNDHGGDSARRVHRSAGERGQGTGEEETVKVLKITPERCTGC